MHAGEKLLVGDTLFNRTIQYTVGEEVFNIDLFPRTDKSN